nr:unnamed protein product [Digitaria exilis]
MRGVGHRRLGLVVRSAPRLGGSEWVGRGSYDRRGARLEVGPDADGDPSLPSWGPREKTPACLPASCAVWAQPPAPGSLCYSVHSHATNHAPRPRCTIDDSFGSGTGRRTPPWARARPEPSRSAHCTHMPPAWTVVSVAAWVGPSRHGPPSSPSRRREPHHATNRPLALAPRAPAAQATTPAGRSPTRPCQREEFGSASRRVHGAARTSAHGPHPRQRSGGLMPCLPPSVRPSVAPRSIWRGSPGAAGRTTCGGERVGSAENDVPGC